MKNENDEVKVTSYNQSGGITAYKVTLVQDSPQRILTSTLKQELLEILTDLPDKIIRISALAGDQEAINFAQQIKNFLTSQNYTIQGVGQKHSARPMRGQEIFNYDEIIEISIGSNV